MANLDNNNEKNKDSLTDNLGDSVKKGVENIQESVKKAAQDATQLASDAIERPVETAGEFVEQAKKDVVSVKWWAKLLQVLFWTALTLVVAFMIIINLPSTKNWAAQKVIIILNKDLKTNFEFSNVDVNYFGDVTIHDLVVRDNKDLKFLKAKTVYADSNWFSIIFDSRNLQFQSLSMDELDLKVITYKGDSISNFIRFVDLFDSGKPSDPSKPPFQLKTRIQLTNSKISIVNENSPGDAGKWLDAKDVNLVVPELRVKGSDVFAQINNLRFKTNRWGKEHYVETFSTDLTLNKQFLQLEDLTINTMHTLLQGDLKFNLNDGKWADFADKVKWDMKLKNGSQLSGYDISYFVTNWDNYKPVNLVGEMNGPLNNFELKNFVIGNRDVAINTSKIKFENLLKGDFTIDTNNLSADFTYKNLKGMLPKFIATKLKNFADDFGRLKYSGSARLTPRQVFIDNGNLITGVGQAKISKLYLNDYSSAMPRYQGVVDLRDLNVAAITKTKQVGLVTGHFDVRGESFDLNTMKLTTRSQIERIEIMDKVVTNVHLDGVLNRKTYNGLVTVNDKQARANVKGLIDFSTSRLKADVLADVAHLNLNYFTGAAGEQIVSGKVNGKIQMSDINDMNLDADLQNVTFSMGKKRYEIPNGNVRAFFENGNRIISVDAPGAVKGRVAGKFNLGDIAGMLQNGIGKILVGPPPRKYYKGQYFDVDLKVEQSLISYFVPDLKVRSGIKAVGSYNGTSNDLVFDIDANRLKYILTSEKEISGVDDMLANADVGYKAQPRTQITKDSAVVDSVMVRINTANLDEQIYAKINRAVYNQNVLKDVVLSGRKDANSVLHLAANFQHGSPRDEREGKMKDYAVNVNQTTNVNGDYIFRFEPTDIKFNDVVWTIDTDPALDHYITYRKREKDVVVHNLVITSEESRLHIKQAEYNNAKDFFANAEISNLDLAKVFKLVKAENSMDLKGIANGTFMITMDNGKLKPIVDLSVKDIFMNEKAMGDLFVKAENSDKPNIYNVKAHIETDKFLGYNNLDVEGTIDSNYKSPKVDMMASMRDFDLSFVQEFVGVVFDNFRGKATGELAIKGDLNSVKPSGTIALKDFGLKLKFTGVDYAFDDNEIFLTEDGKAILNNIGVRDGRSNSKGSISGLIGFEKLSQMNLALFFRADNLMVLNTTQKDFDLFWGRVYGQGSLTIDGPVSGLKIETAPGEPFQALNNSTFTFNSNSTSNVEEFKMLRFLQASGRGGVISVAKQEEKGANLAINFNLAVDKGTTINVLVGDDIGDISVRGNSPSLDFRMDRKGNIGMNGTYFVENGTFVSKAILNRTFQIEKGSNIRWDGDAMSPALDIKANYVRTVSNAGQYLNLGSLQPINILLQAKISQTLSNPAINLGVSAIDVSSNVKETLASKMSQEDEKIIQFGSILVMNSFNVTDAAGGLNIGNMGDLGLSTGYNMALKQLGSVLNTISNDVQVDLNYIKGDAGSNTGDRANAGVRVAVSPRVTLKTGLGIPLSRNETSSAPQLLSGEGSIEYDISKKNDGTLVLRGYSKPTNIGMIGTGNTSNGSVNQTYGAGVAWTKSFNTLFKGKKKKNKSETKAVNAEIEKDSIKK